MIAEETTIVRAAEAVDIRLATIVDHRNTNAICLLKTKTANVITTIVEPK